MVEQADLNIPADEEKNNITDTEARVIIMSQNDNQLSERLVANCSEPDFSTHQQNILMLKKTKGLKI